MMPKITDLKVEGKEENCQRDGLSWPYIKFVLFSTQVFVSFEGDVTPAIQERTGSK